MSEVKSLKLVADGGKLPTVPRRGAGRIDFRVLIFGGCPVRNLLIVPGKRKRKSRQVIRGAQFFDGFCRWIQPEEMCIGLLLGREIDAIRSPADEPRVFIEGSRQNLRRSAFRGHHGDFYLRLLEEFPP